MAIPWTSDHGTFPAQMDSQPCVITVDLGAIEHGPVASHPIFLGFRVHMQQWRDDGLTEVAEAPALNALHERLNADVAALFDGLFVARYVTDRCLFLVYYVPNAPVHVQSLTEGRDPYRPEIFVEDDADWSVLNNLAPNDWQRQLIADIRLRYQLSSLGDQPSIKRKIDHTLLIPLAVDLTQPLAQLQAHGYAVDTVRVDGDEHVVVVSREDHLGDAAELIGYLFDFTKELGGSYDGWGSPVMKG